MTHKAKCIEHCKEYLSSLNLAHYFNSTDFEHIYRKFNGSMGNAFSIGLNTADFILMNAKPMSEQIEN